MTKETIELIEADLAFDSASEAFSAVVKVWKQRGEPKSFPALGHVAADYAAALLRLRAAFNATAPAKGGVS